MEDCSSLLNAKLLFHKDIQVKLLDQTLAFYNIYTNETHILESSLSEDFLDLISHDSLTSDFLNQYPEEQREYILEHFKQLIEACLSIDVIDKLST